MILPLPRMITYSGVKPCSMSTPILDFGRSITWPTDAFTVNPLPRYFLMVLALAGDSTTTSAFSVPPLVAVDLADLASLAGASLAGAFFFVALTAPIYLNRR